MPKEKTYDKAQVVDTVINLFQKKGYNGTSMQDIVETTKLGRSSIYNSFDSKQGLFEEVLKSYGARYNKLITKAIDCSSNAFEAIHNIFGVHINVIVNDKTHSGCLWVNTKAELWNTDKYMTEVLKKSQKDFLNLFVNLVELGQKEKTINSNSNAESYALYLITAIHGLRLTGKSHQNRKELEELTSLSLKCLE
ncbi:TetR/AcrR family transcriptional regulator [Maribacter sp. BPC-D8]|uniref:TetR/AcrR family transcriptional regulator n=1 Tax=Maribacter sp. BPC-D8 TaxID=3053613 RepID=UPI002B484C40|nr:TetR/AcrR family transcriptional regulator [Maribacter sp. BPC-D8]WRI30550.1 TetR/AcrR family transcriptional regulator [Maribacter sp. BPC-D8]